MTLNSNKDPYDNSLNQLRDMIRQKQTKTAQTKSSQQTTVDKNKTDKESESTKSSATQQSRQKSIANDREKSTISRSQQSGKEKAQDISQKHPSLPSPSDKPAQNKEILTGQKQASPSQQQSHQLISQIAQVAQNHTPSKNESLSDSFESMLKQVPKASQGDATKFVNSSLQSNRANTSVEYNKQLSDFIQGSKEQFPNMETANKFPEHKDDFQVKDPEMMKQLDKGKQEAKESVGKQDDTLRTKTESTDRSRTASLHSFDKQVKDSSLSERDKNIQHRISAGDFDSPEKSKHLSDNHLKTHETFMQNAKDASKVVDKDFKDISSTGAYNDLKGVMSALKGEDDVKKDISKELSKNGEKPDLDKAMDELRSYRDDPNKPQTMSPKRLVVYQQADAKLSENHSKLADKNLETFREGWKQAYNEKGIGKDPTLDKKVAEALRDPSSALVKNTELLSKQQGIIQDLTNAGLTHIEQWPKRYTQMKNNVRNIGKLLARAPRNLVKKGTSFSELKKQLKSTPEGRKLLKDLSDEAGLFDGEELELDSGIFDEVLSSVQRPRMKMQFQAVQFGEEFMSAGREVLDELIKMKSSSDDAQSTDPSEMTFGGISVMQYEVAMGSFSAKMSETFTMDEISNIDAQGAISNAKRTINELQYQENMRAEKQAQEQAQKGPIGKIFGGLKEIFVIQLDVMVGMAFPPVTLLIGGKLLSSDVKNIKTEGFSAAS
ncbi:MAG: hypothetical protein AAGG81_03800, partial [Chlamydiota bacterium]